MITKDQQKKFNEASEKCQKFSDNSRAARHWCLAGNIALWIGFVWYQPLYWAGIVVAWFAVVYGLVYTHIRWKRAFSELKKIHDEIRLQATKVDDEIFRTF